MGKAQRAGNSDRLMEAVIQGIQEMKGKDVVRIDLRGMPNRVCDQFVVCHGDSDTQVAAIAGSVEKFARERAGERPWHVEGLRNAEWVLLDFVDVVVHIFHRAKREHYGLEQLWADAPGHRYENVA